MKTKFILLLITLMVLGLSVQASATLIPGFYVDEYGGFANLPHGLQNDPGPGGLSNALTYDLLNPLGLVAGDVLLMEKDGSISDLIRFNPDEIGPHGGLGTLVFYSDNSDTDDYPAPADIGLPGSFYENFITLPEIRIYDVRLKPFDGAVYTPGPNQPGYFRSNDSPYPATYIIISETVPEPSTLLLLGVGLLGILLTRKRFKG